MERHSPASEEGREPVAVIGLACRFAGDAESPEAFWDMLITGRDGIANAPAERWESYRGLGPDYASAVRQADVPGGFLGDIAGFDSAFFGLTPREAELMDPQQRLLLELAWEALEHAGVPPRDLAGGDTGVFVGIGSDDYGRRMLEDLPSIEAWTGIGSSMCAAANRISHLLDLRGPSLAVDTACSASLVATHLACQSLREGECSLALVGGVNLIISPGLTLTLRAAGATAADGRCKPFDASADGYGRGEGGGLLVLKTLSAAQRDGDRVLAVIRGGAVQQDGRTNGIMAPSGDAQRALVAEACRRAGVTPESVGYVEAHGTGTGLGDPLEAGALSAVYGHGRPSGRPCLIGSVKPNIGHLEAGAGVASLIKATLALANEEIPPSLNFTTGNPAIDWDGSGLSVVTRRTRWPRTDRPRRAGVSGFGYGGTISHLLLEEAPLPSEYAECQEPASGVSALYPLSAASETALRATAERLAEVIAGAEPPLGAVGHTLARRRSHLEHRAAIVAAGRADLVGKLRAVAEGTPARGTMGGTSGDGRDTGVVWVFSGHGSQWPGMGRELLASEPAFAAALDELDPVFVEEAGLSARDLILSDDLSGVDRVQMAIFVMQVGLTAVWRSYGVAPAAVIGHSVGEIAAAVACGGLSPQDGARLSCRRSGLLRKVAGAGAMAMASLPFATAHERLAGRADVVAAISASPGSTVISGSPDAVEKLIEQWSDDTVQMRRVASDVAFHSPQMDDLVDELAAAADLSPRRPRAPMYRTALPDPRATDELNGAYWAANLRNPVLLTSATLAAVEDGYRTFIEISPHPVVAHSVRETLTEHNADNGFVGSTLRRDTNERESLLTALGAAHCRGVDIDWSRMHPSRELVTLPPVAWRRQRHWHGAEVTAVRQGLQHDVDSGALLGSEVPVAGRSLRLWRTLLDEAARPYPGHHTVNGTEIVPAAVVLATFMAAADSTALDDVVLRLPLVVAERREVQVTVEGNEVQLASATDDGGWLTHSTAVASEGGPEAAARVRGLRAADPEEVVRRLAQVGVPTMAFSWTVEELLRGDAGLRARVQVGPATSWAPVLDAALSVAPAVYAGDPTLRMVAGIGLVRTGPQPPETVDIEVTEQDEVLDVVIRDPSGEVVARLSQVRYAAVNARTTRPLDLVHEVTWQPLELPNPTPERELVLLDVEPGLVAALRGSGAHCRVVHGPDELAELGGAVDIVVQAAAPEAGVSVPEAAARSAWRLLDAVQQTPGSSGARLWCVTVGVRESVAAGHVAQAPLWGLGRVLATEYGDTWGGIVDLPADRPADAAATLLQVVRCAPRQDVIGLRAGVVTTAELRRTEAARSLRPLTCRPEGTYLITGGLGRLGLEVARWLAERGARRLVLAGRRGLPDRPEWDAVHEPDVRRQIEGVRALEAMGVTVRVVALDLADSASVAHSLLESPEARGLPPISGVVHAAGVLDNRMAAHVDEASVRSVLRPKVDGAWVLHTFLPPGTVDFFVLFSSCGHLLGLPGQAAYGAANAFLDALAAHRGDALSLGWTSWQGLGMAVNDQVDRGLRAQGVTTISASEAFAAWDIAAQIGPGHYPVLGTLPLEAGMDRAPVLSGLSEVPVDDAPAGLPDSLADLPADALRERVLEIVGEQIAEEMRLAAAVLDVRRPLVEQGMDSVMTIMVRRRLEKRFGQTLPSALLWQQPTVTAIAEHLVERLSAG
ncbi:type I polyketide synthase [Streptomyces sp. E5N91]|uniref:type I polyketide synthase n=1 Tax=Streptomyces sp. E5N91 TaxID=1851996 RepID=UPI000EF5AFD9|nr:type I polyketide synthase [Streptomyces sp. E5N91]